MLIFLSPLLLLKQSSEVILYFIIEISAVSLLSSIKENFEKQLKSYESFGCIFRRAVGKFGPKCGFLFVFTFFLFFL